MGQMNCRINRRRVDNRSLQNLLLYKAVYGVYGVYGYFYIRYRGLVNGFSIVLLKTYRRTVDRRQALNALLSLSGSPQTLRTIIP
jgi:hypothetical protein